MNLDNIEVFLKRSYTLKVHLRPREGRYHARVDLGNADTSHNFMGASISEALEGLNRYLHESVMDAHAHSGSELLEPDRVHLPSG